MSKALMTILTSLILNSCTYSVTMMHTEGSTDTLDEAQTSEPNISPNVNIPLTPGAGLGLTK